MKKAYTNNDLLFLARTVSGNDLKHYDEARLSAGPYAITPAMVETFGVPDGGQYFPDLMAADSPYNDFRFNSKQSLEFVLNASAELWFDGDRRLDLFLTATVPYIGVSAVKEAISTLTRIEGEATNMLILRYCANLQATDVVRKDPYLIVLTNVLRSQYARGLV